MGKTIIKAGNPTIVDLFTAKRIYERVGSIGYNPLVTVEYEPKYEKLRNELVNLLDELNIYALGSIVTVEAFKHPRVVKVDSRNHVFILSKRASDYMTY